MPTRTFPAAWSRYITASSKTTKPGVTSWLRPDYAFESQTHTEVIAHLIHRHYLAGGDLFEAVRQAVRELLAPTPSA